MTKKFKIKDLENEPELSSRLDKDYTKISINELLDEPQSGDVLPPVAKSAKEVKKTSSPPPQEKVVTKVEVIQDQVRFERHQIYSYLFKVLSFTIILFIIDLVVHFLKFMNGVEVLKLENYHSVLLGPDLHWNLIKVASFLLGVFLITPNERLLVNRRGIYCNKVDILNFFYTTSQVYLTWDDIAAVKYDVKFFEPYLFFYGRNKEVLGQIDFSLEKRNEFFQFIEKNAGKNHPLFKVKADLSLF